MGALAFQRGSSSQCVRMHVTFDDVRTPPPFRAAPMPITIAPYHDADAYFLAPLFYFLRLPLDIT